ncbi:MAG: FG-GAP repeat protein [Xanthomonadales bacterium]|nr:FG-GAP repeat protein [Xanthomonadales bacterium]
MPHAQPSGIRKRIWPLCRRASVIADNNLPGFTGAAQCTFHFHPARKHPDPRWWPWRWAWRCLPCRPRREHLGPYNNLLLKNPHPDAAGKQYGRGLAAGDFRWRGTSDLVVSEAGGDRLRVLRGLAFAVGSNPLLQFLSTTINMPVHSYTMASGDFDGDGRDEIAVSAMNASAGGGLQLARS